MFDVGASELLLTVIVAIVVIGPKDLPLALRTAGRWIGKLRRISSHFRTGIDAMIREAELEEMEKEWKERNARIMAGDHGPHAQAAVPPPAPSSAEQTASPPPAGAEARARRAAPPAGPKELEEPQLPLGGPPPPP